MWLADPVTQFVRDWAVVQRTELRDAWEGAHFVGQNTHQEVVKNSAAQGACSVYRQIEALDYEDMMGVRKDVSTAEGSGEQSGY